MTLSVKDMDDEIKFAHTAWLIEKSIKGWSYGPVLDEEKKQHPDFMPYEELVEREVKRAMADG